MAPFRACLHWLAASLGPGPTPVVDDIGVAVPALRRIVVLPPVLGVVCKHLRSGRFVDQRERLMPQSFRVMLTDQ